MTLWLVQCHLGYARAVRAWAWAATQARRLAALAKRVGTVLVKLLFRGLLEYGGKIFLRNESHLGVSISRYRVVPR